MQHGHEQLLCRSSDLLIQLRPRLVLLCSGGSSDLLLCCCGLSKLLLLLLFLQRLPHRCRGLFRDVSRHGFGRPHFCAGLRDGSAGLRDCSPRHHFAL